MCLLEAPLTGEVLRTYLGTEYRI